jgi:hypothetical protein
MKRLAVVSCKPYLQYNQASPHHTGFELSTVSLIVHKQIAYEKSWMNIYTEALVDKIISQSDKAFADNLSDESLERLRYLTLLYHHHRYHHHYHHHHHHHHHHLLLHHHHHRYHQYHHRYHQYHHHYHHHHYHHHHYHHNTVGEAQATGRDPAEPEEGRRRGATVR